jgi:hypothetical protein
MTNSEINLDYLFQDQILNFVHLLTVEKKTKSEFLSDVKNTYCISNPKTELFCIACERSIFKTIQLNAKKDTILLT